MINQKHYVTAHILTRMGIEKVISKNEDDETVAKVRTQWPAVRCFRVTDDFIQLMGDNGYSQTVQEQEGIVRQLHRFGLSQSQHHLVSGDVVVFTIT